MNLTDPLSERDPVYDGGYERFMRQIRAGHLSASWVSWREVYLEYKAVKLKYPNTAIVKTAEKLDMPKSTIHHIIKKFE